MTLEDLKRKVKEETPISSILERYVSVTRRGPQCLALCPFHNDSKPSLHINDQKQMFMCFVDNIGGDAISFVMRFKNLDFIEALRDICSTMGWNFDDYNQEKPVHPKKKMALKVLDKACKIYQKVGHSARENALTNFAQARNISDQQVKFYQLGHSPSHNVMVEYLKSIKDDKDREMALEVALEIGLIRNNQSDQFFDTFRERTMFPIWDYYGQVIGFTSRATQDYQKAKYMNSIDSFVFNKKNLLYGFHFASKAMRAKDAAIIVEGNMDQLSLFNNGFEHSVAIMGVALGQHALERLLQVTKNIYLCLDNDQAGHKASERINRQFLEAGIVPYSVDLAEFKDPDDFIQGKGRLAFQEKLDQALPMIDHLLNQLTPDPLPTILSKQLELLEKANEILAPLGTSLEATERLIKFAAKIGLKSTNQQIIEKYKQYLKPGQNSVTPQPRPKDHEEVQASVQDHVPAVTESFLKLSRIDKTLINEISRYPYLLALGDSDQLLDFTDQNEVKDYILRVRELIHEVDEIHFGETAKQLLGSDQFSLAISEVAQAALYQYRPMEWDDKTYTKHLADLTQKLKVEKLKLQKENLKQSQSQCQNQDELDQVLEKILILDREIIKVKNKNTLRP